MDNRSQSLDLVLSTLGFVSFGLLWLGVVTGFLLRGSWRPPLLSSSALQGLHGATSGVGLSLGAVHAAGQLAVPGTSITVLELVVPFADQDDRIGTGVAVVGSEVLLAVALSVIVQRWWGAARWRSLHLFSYAAFMLIVAHVLISGTDVTPVRVWLPVLGAWLVTVVLWLTSTSLLASRPPSPAPPDRAPNRTPEGAPREAVLRWVAERLPDRDGPAPAGTRALGSASPLMIEPPRRRGDVSAVPGVRRRPATWRGDR